MEGYGSSSYPNGRVYGENENLTLTDADLAATGKRPQPSKGGEALRYRCPVHGGDHQNSLKLNTRTGRFECYACHAWGYMDWAREAFARERGLDEQGGEGFSRMTKARRIARKASPPPPPPPPVAPVRDDLDALLAGYQEALPGSWGERYLEHRGIPLEVAVAHGVGYAAPKAWAGRKWKGGRLVFGHYRPDGTLVNMYGRAVAKGDVPKQLKHDHLSGNKGWFHARALRDGDGPLFVCEAALDALALIASGHERTVAIYGTYGWRWDWVPKDVREIVIAADADEGGDKVRETIGTEARLRGIRVAYLDGENYGGEKDAAAAYAAGVLTVGEFPGSVSHEEAEDGDAPSSAAGESPLPAAVRGERRDYRAEARASMERARRTLERDDALDGAPPATTSPATLSATPPATTPPATVAMGEEPATGEPVAGGAAAVGEDATDDEAVQRRALEVLEARRLQREQRGSRRGSRRVPREGGEG